jgi:Icc-related predicted phosphoesterase
MSCLLYATDLHGNVAAYEELFALPAEAIVLGGDLLPHPSGAGERLLEIQRAFARDYLAAKFRSRPCFWIPGNDDLAAALAPLDGVGTPIHGRAVEFLDGLWIAGYACVPVTPFSLKDFDRYDDDGWEPARVPRSWKASGPAGWRATSPDGIRSLGTIARDLERLAALSDPAKTVYVAHTPPWGTGLDRLGDGTPVGSRALRAFLERRGPPLSLHGHIHESPGVARLGRTVAVQPGDSAARLRAVRVNLGDFSVTPLLP